MAMIHVQGKNLIEDGFKTLVHGIPYVVTFIVMQNSVLDSSYFMLLGHPWLKDAKVSHEWGNNTITIQGIDIVRITLVTKKLGAPTKRAKMLVSYDFHFEIFDKKKDLMFATKPRLFFNRNHNCLYTSQVRATY